jgi:hypothetical protein
LDLDENLWSGVELSHLQNHTVKLLKYDSKLETQTRLYTGADFLPWKARTLMHLWVNPLHLFLSEFVMTWFIKKKEFNHSNIEITQFGSYYKEEMWIKWWISKIITYIGAC